MLGLRTLPARRTLTPALSPGQGEGESAVRRGFSLIEVLLAIFILGIGIISIAALFPAGIAQQRLSNDDMMGPIVANHAMSILRGKLRQEDFGTIEEFAEFAAIDYLSPTIAGDWGWMRPGVLLDDDPTTPRINEYGALDIFSFHRVDSNSLSNASELFEGWPGSAAEYWPWLAAGVAGSPVLFGIPFNLWEYGGGTDPPTPPQFIITQGERYYPMQREVGLRLEQRPQYVWECMFRRYGGRVYVAIFVYRVTMPSSMAEYRTPENPDAAQSAYSFLPWRRSMGTRPWNAGAGAPNTFGAANRSFAGWVLGTQHATYDPGNIHHAWQEPRQWLLDQNMNIHRVLGNQKGSAANDAPNNMVIELTRGVEPVLGWGNTLIQPSATPNWYDSELNYNVPDWVEEGVVTDIWYIPREIEVPGGGGETLRLTPVYITVKEL